MQLPFKIYWGTSLSITLILGLSMVIWSVWEKPKKWPKTHAVLSWTGVMWLVALVVKKASDGDDSQHKTPNQNPQDKGNSAITKRSSDAALAINAQPTPTVAPHEEIIIADNHGSTLHETMSNAQLTLTGALHQERIMADDHRSTPYKTESKLDVEAAVIDVDPAKPKVTRSRCPVM